MKEIKYVGYYYFQNELNRNGSLAAINKMNYISEAIQKCGYKVKLISPSIVTDKHSKLSARNKVKVNDNFEVLLAPSLGAKNRVIRHLSFRFSQLWLFFNLLTKTKKNEELIVYHSLSLMTIILLAKKIKGFKLILEVEEIYQDVVNCSKFKRKQEYAFFKNADKFLFPTILLNEKINPNNKPFALIHGTYHAEKDYNVKFNDDKIHIVYAGTFEPKKGGATAAAATEYLPENYHIHIIGFGSKEQTQEIKNLIDVVNQKSKATVTYDGLLKGEDYIKFLQKCQIGLSTQNPDASYNDTSFPSKILSYIANGLRVLTVRIKAIETSAIGNDVFYYDKQTPEEIANSILKIDFSKPYESREIIKSLDSNLIKQLSELLK